MKTQPVSLQAFSRRYPEVGAAFAALGEACHEKGGPLDEKTRRLAKLALAIGSQHEGAVHSATRHALEAGVTPDELMHVAVLAITTIGWPGAYAAVTWIADLTTPD